MIGPRMFFGGNLLLHSVFVQRSSFLSRDAKSSGPWNFPTSTERTFGVSRFCGQENYPEQTTERFPRITRINRSFSALGSLGLQPPSSSVTGLSELCEKIRPSRSFFAPLCGQSSGLSLPCIPCVPWALRGSRLAPISADERFKMSRTPAFCRSLLAGDFTFHRLTTSWIARKQAPTSGQMSLILEANWNERR